MPVAYTADKIFTGEEWITNHAIVVQDTIITGITPLSDLNSTYTLHSFKDYFIAPAFIDLQLYGAYGKLFSVYPETDSLVKLKEYCEKGGAAFCMPTVATNTYEVFYKCIDAIRSYWNNNGEGILGLHLEGPWINAAKRGAHNESLIHSPTFQQAEALLNYGKGVIKIITLAPEVCSKEIIEVILSHDIIISAGHSNATYQQAKTGFENGITTVTHLYNAMSMLQHRSPGLVGATMDDAAVMASIIPDGWHVDYAAVRIAKQVMKERLFVITDSVTETTIGDYQHKMEGDKYEAGGILSGSALNMRKAVENLIQYCEIELAEALRMCSWYPAKVAGLKKHGKIAKGFNAKMIVMNEKLEIQQML